MKKYLVKLTFTLAPMVMMFSIINVGMKCGPIIHEPKVPSRLRNI